MSAMDQKFFQRCTILSIFPSIKRTSCSYWSSWKALLWKLLKHFFNTS